MKERLIHTSNIFLQDPLPKNIKEYGREWLHRVLEYMMMFMEDEASEISTDWLDVHVLTVMEVHEFLPWLSVVFIGRLASWVRDNLSNAGDPELVDMFFRDIGLSQVGSDGLYKFLIVPTKYVPKTLASLGGQLCSSATGFDKAPRTIFRIQSKPVMIQLGKGSKMASYDKHIDTGFDKLATIARFSPTNEAQIRSAGELLNNVQEVLVHTSRIYDLDLPEEERELIRKWRRLLRGFRYAEKTYAAHMRATGHDSKPMTLEELKAIAPAVPMKDLRTQENLVDTLPEYGAFHPDRPQLVDESIWPLVEKGKLIAW
ncbi:hypothetical protein KEM56_007200 [Ascosphaera pollenicola]|nr:hypothetical protein KEM56_007200 [Ascosphaera pollenicola]